MSATKSKFLVLCLLGMEQKPRLLVRKSRPRGVCGIQMPPSIDSAVRGGTPLTFLLMPGLVMWLTLGIWSEGKWCNPGLTKSSGQLFKGHGKSLFPFMSPTTSPMCPRPSAWMLSEEAAGGHSHHMTCAREVTKVRRLFRTWGRGLIWPNNELVLTSTAFVS